MGKVHSVVYEDSSEEFHFNLLEDLSVGDLIIQ